MFIHHHVSNTWFIFFTSDTNLLCHSLWIKGLFYNKYGFQHSAENPEFSHEVICQYIVGLGMIFNDWQMWNNEWICMERKKEWNPNNFITVAINKLQVSNLNVCFVEKKHLRLKIKIWQQFLCKQSNENMQTDVNFSCNNVTKYIYNWLYFCNIIW